MPIRRAMWSVACCVAGAVITVEAVQNGQDGNSADSFGVALHLGLYTFVLGGARTIR